MIFTFCSGISGPPTVSHRAFPQSPTFSPLVPSLATQVAFWLSFGTESGRFGAIYGEDVVEEEVVLFIPPLCPTPLYLDT